MTDPPPGDLLHPSRRRLDGWKAIAGSLRKDVRTSQRWEEQEGLPIHREGVNVFAYTDEIDQWREARIKGPSPQTEPVAPRDAGTGARQENLRSRDLRSAIAAILALIVVVTLAVYLRPPQAPVVLAVPQWGRVLARSTSEGTTPRLFRIGYRPGPLAVTPDGSKLYAASAESPFRALSVVRTSSGTAASLALPGDITGLVMSPDGSRLYVGQGAGGIAVVDVATDRVLPPRIRTPGSVNGFAISADGKKLFIATGPYGVWRALTLTGEIKQLTHEGCPTSLATGVQGKTLVVSYQCGGPGGRSGHDAVEVFDTEAEQSLGTASGPPFVGGGPSVSPDERLVALDGIDACRNPSYDEEGCPGVPSHVFQFLRLRDRQFVKSLGMPLHSRGPWFIGSDRLVFWGGSMIRVMNAAQYTVEEDWADKSVGVLNNSVFASRQGMAYFGLEQSRSILSFEVENSACSAPSEGLVSFYPGDGVNEDVIGGVSLTPVGDVAFGPGRVGQAFVFGGRSGYLATPQTGANRFGHRDSTFAAYVKFATVDREMAVFDLVAEETKFSSRLTKGADERFHFELSTNNGSAIHLDSQTLSAANRWYHLSVTKNDQEVVLFVDGLPEDRRPLANLSDVLLDAGDLQELRLGATVAGKSFLDGKLDEVMFYSRAFSKDDVRRLYEIRESGPCKL